MKLRLTLALWFVCALFAMARNPYDYGLELVPTDQGDLTIMLNTHNDNPAFMVLLQRIFLNGQPVIEREYDLDHFRGRHQSYELDLAFPELRQLDSAPYEMELKLAATTHEGQAIMQSWRMDLEIYEGQIITEKNLFMDDPSREEAEIRIALKQAPPMDQDDLWFDDVEMRVSDPATYTSYPCYYIHNRTYNYPSDGIGNVVAKIRWPSSTCNSADGPPSNRPVLMFTHGNGMGYDDHSYLMAHLAKNGFVTVSIENSGSNENRGKQHISFLNALHTYWTWKSRLSTKVAFSGHSRGGEGAVTAARLLGDNPSMGAKTFDVRAVIALAPTDGGGADGNFPKENLRGYMADGFLAIHGTHDDDVVGVQDTAFGIYDRAGSEYSSEGLVIAGTHMQKAMIFVDGANHKRFEDDSFGLCQTVGSPLSCEDHNSVAKAYFNGFLRWRLYGHSSYRDIFDGTETPASIDHIDLFRQFQDNVRRVVDNFENGNISSNNLGGTVYQGSGIVVMAEGDLHSMDNHTPHETDGLRIKWSTSSGSAYVGFVIPNSSPFGIGSLRDVSGYDFISLRAGQNYLDAWNDEDEIRDFYVRLYTSNGWSPKVKVSDHGAYMNYPVFYERMKGGLLSDHTKSAMETIRIPLSAFTGANLNSVSHVYLYFDVPGSTAGSVHIDNLEFTD